MKSTPNTYMMLYFGQNFSHLHLNAKFLTTESLIFNRINQFPLKMVTKAEFFVKLPQKKSKIDTPNNSIIARFSKNCLIMRVIVVSFTIGRLFSLETQNI